MNRIDTLLATLCPEGVDFTPIGEFGQLVRGNGMPKSDFAETGVGCIHYGQIYTFYGAWATETKSFIPAEKAARLAKVDPGDLIITNTSENLDDVCKAVAWLGDSQIVTGGHATVLKHGQDAKYLSYYLQTPQFFAEKKRHATGTKVIDVSAKSLAKIRIPLPPLKIQQEVVAILDQFTKLEAELEAELEARRAQYRHYRDTLLSFSGQTDSQESKQATRILTLGDVFKMRAGQHIPAHNIENDRNGSHLFPCFGGNGVRGFVQHHSHNGSFLLIGRQGALCGNIQRASGKFYATEHAVVAKPNDGIDVDWAFHMLTQMNLNQYASKSAQPGLAVGKLASVEICVPPLDEQKRIASVLDKFDMLVNDLSDGLPAEIKARRQQYEYYRDQLLTFKQAA